MGALNFISSNPTTAAIRVNEARDMQQAQAAESLLAARDARQRQADMDAAYGAAADEMVAKPRPSLLSAVAPQTPPQGDGMLAPVEPTAQTYSAAQPRVSPLATVTTDSGTGNPVSALKGMRNAGQLRYQMAQAQQKRTDDANIQALKAIHDGDYGLADALDKKYGLGIGHVLNDPNALSVTKDIVKSRDKINMNPGQALAYQEAGTKAFSEEFAKTRNYNQAIMKAGEAGMRAAMAVPGDMKHFSTDDQGNITGITADGKARRIEGAKGRTKGSSGAGGVAGGANSKGAKFDVDGEGNRVILYRDGTMVYPKDSAGNPVKIKAGTNEDQKFVRNLVAGAEKNRFPEAGENPVDRAKDLARQTKTGTLPAQPATATARIRFDANGNQIK